MNELYWFICGCCATLMVGITILQINTLQVQRATVRYIKKNKI